MQGGDYLRGGTIHEHHTYGVPKIGLRREKTIYEGGLYMKTVRMEYQRAEYAGGDYLRGGPIHEHHTYGVPKSGLRREKTIYEGGLYMKTVRMEYQIAD